jgi:hypothetical protein
MWRDSVTGDTTLKQVKYLCAKPVTEFLGFKMDMHNIKVHVIMADTDFTLVTICFSTSMKLTLV